MASPSLSRLAKVTNEALGASPDAARLRQTVNAEIDAATLQGSDQMWSCRIRRNTCNSSWAFCSMPFPHTFAALILLRPSASKIGTLRGVWITVQIKRNVMDITSAEAPKLSEIATIFASTSTLMGMCWLPLYIPQTKAVEWFDIWRMITEQRMTRHDWPFMGSEEERQSSHPSILSLRSIAERNQARARRRYLRARGLTPREDDGEVWDDNS